MPIAIVQTASVPGVDSVANVCTYSGVSIGEVVSGRVVCLLVATENAGLTINSATIDYGTGDVAMTAGTQGQDLASGAARYARVFYLAVPSGTTATFKVTVGAATTTTQNYVAVYSLQDANPTAAATGGDGTDDAGGDPLTTGAITVPTNGCFIGVVCGGNDGAVRTWTNATEDLDLDGGALRFSSAYSLTAGGATITCAGQAAENAAMAWATFNFKPPSSLVYDPLRYIRHVLMR